MKRKRPNQLELRTVGEEFNLFSEKGEDPIRVEFDRLRRASEQAAAREYELKMQRVFASCPGFIEGDAPEGERGKGSVTVVPTTFLESLSWLKRRFHVSEHAEPVPAANGLRFEIIPRQRNKVRQGTVRVRVKVNFSPPEQFTLAL